MNGERLDPKTTFSTFDEAFLGDLDEVRKALGWWVQLISLVGMAGFRQDRGCPFS
jgi:hypothetical protein